MLIQLIRDIFERARAQSRPVLSFEFFPTKSDAAERTLLNGPARMGEGLDQADVDAVMGMTPPSESATRPDAPPLQPAADIPDAPAAGSETRLDRRYDPLAPLAAMTEAEKIALFT